MRRWCRTSSYRQLGSVWVTRELLLRDLRDGTQTRLRIDELELNVELEGVPLTPEALREQKQQLLGVGTQ